MPFFAPPDAASVIVLSSHVVRGSVGNRAAVFALESLGFPVWAVPTVVLPWHPGHGPAGRIVPPPQEFALLIKDIERAPWLGEVGAILTGFLGHPEQAEAIAVLIRALKEKNPEIIYLCDPVIGDEGGLYVPEATACAIRDKLLPLADIATPNRFELEWLADVSLSDNNTLMEAALDIGPATVVVTSAFPMLKGSIGNILVTPNSAFMAEHRCVKGPTNGLGDLTAALILARKMTGLSEEKTLQSSTAAVFEVMARAAKRGADELMLEADAASLATPMAMVQTRRLVHPTTGLRI
ncbi:pyridoxal kinase PdxY [Falsochrobactrum ovis]|uniref:pyridoxal kinase n=1 Tax=Falsochrobactrum ovis TaxID=1293442 RepID=A0A364JW72_9HYPH|nr:pyridoxal kinase PdxY [Falsochrobactrum ovis]RAK30089.1 pyridoxal kinase [Falsochrobactrum ovis]